MIDSRPMPGALLSCGHASLVSHIILVFPLSFCHETYHSLSVCARLRTRTYTPVSSTVALLRSLVPDYVCICTYFMTCFVHYAFY